jgi:CRISPR-associated protein Csd2
MSTDKRYDFAILFDVQDGNPNGDPDAGNLPRIDPETGHGLVTDVCLKRKLRNFVLLTKGQEEGFDIFVKEKAVLNLVIDKAHEQPEVMAKEKGEKTEAARKYMCKHFYDVRAFGAVMSTGKNAGQVRGPVQLTFSRSVIPIVSQEHSITRMAVATEAEAEKQAGDNRTMGRKATVPYGLYVGHGFFSSSLAAQTGFNDQDLALLWRGLLMMFEQDRSAARGLMATRRLIVFEHASNLGNATASSLFERIRVRIKDDVETPRAFSDFTIEVDRAGLPEGIRILEPNFAGELVALK